MKILKYCLFFCVCGFLQAMFGIACVPAAVALAAAEGAAAGMAAGLFAGLFFSTLPLKYAWLSALVFGLMGGLTGCLRRPLSRIAGGVTLVFLAAALDAVVCLHLGRAEMTPLLREVMLQTAVSVIVFAVLFLVSWLLRRKKYA